MTIKKRSTNEFKHFLNDLSSQSWLKYSPQKWWPRYLFHYSDVNNIAKILRCGFVYSRHHMINNANDFIDIANSGVIQGTEEETQKFVRLYFRPRTPTQFCNEGIRPPEQRDPSGAHCPVPVFLLFDSLSILERSDSHFSNGNAGSHTRNISDSFDDFKEYPFQLIYHERYFNPEEKKEIIFHRNAEVLIPTRLDLSSLKFIVCRSEAEKETLINMLDKVALSRWQDKVVYRPEGNLFYRRWTFVEKVNASPSSIIFYFSPDSKTPGPFNISLNISDMDTKENYTFSSKNFYTTNRFFSQSLNPVINSYTAELWMDDSLACKVVYKHVLNLF